MKRLASLLLFGVWVFCGLCLWPSSHAEASHFRGGTLSYRIVSGRTVEFTMEAYIRANTSGGHGTFRFGDGKTFNMRPTFTRLPDGTRVYRIQFRHTYAKDGNYTASWGSCCWISGISNRSGSWNHRVKVVIRTPVNNPPVINSPVYFSSCTNVPFSTQLNASDPDKDKITYKLSSAPSGMTINTSGRILWPTPRQGKSVFTVVVTDTKGAEAFREMLLEVGGQCKNRPPTIKLNPTAVTVKGGSQACTTVTAQDPDVNRIQVLVSPTKAGATKPPTSQNSPQTFKYCWTPTLADAGQTHNILFTVLDNGNPILTAQAVFKVTVTTGKPPTITLAPAGTTKTVKENASISFSATAADPDGNGIKSFTVTGLPPFCTSTTAGSRINVTCKPGYNDGGKSYKLTFHTTDKDSTPRSSSVVVTLVVENVNRTPTLTGTTSYTVAEGQTLTFSLNASDPDKDTLNWTTAGLPSGATFTGTGNKRTFTWTPGYNQSGIYFLTVFVEDTGVPKQRAALSIRITVVERNLPPKITSTPPTSATEDQQYTYQAKGTDPDAGDTLLWSLTSGPSTAKVDPRTGLLTWTPGDNDVEKTLQFTLVVCDRGNLCATQKWTIKAKNINDRPRITSTPNTQVNEKRIYTYSPRAVDPDPNESLTWVLKTAPTGATIDKTTGKLSWKPSSSNIEVTFEIEVCDKAKTCDKQRWKVKVTNTNDAPKITSTPPNTATEGKLYDYTPSAVDPDPADQLRLSWTLVRAPRTANFNRQTGRLTWTPTSADVKTGSFDFEIQVCDPQNVCDTQRWTVKVKNVNDAPKITTKPTLLAYVGEKFTYAARATDPDPSDILRWSLKQAPNSSTINPGTGVFTWTPNPSDGNKGFTIVIQVCDNGSPKLCVTQKFNLLVRQKCQLDVNCPSGEICIPKDGLFLCDPSYCTIGKTCKKGEYCLLGRCKTNLCANKKCGPGSVCRPTDGKCIQPCAGVTCSAGKLCRDGACVADPCGNTPCRADEVCDTSDAKNPRCVRNPCTPGSCRNGRVCSDGGRCVDDACSAMTCPSKAQRCLRGQCIDRLPCRVDVQCPGSDICVDGRCYPAGCNLNGNACKKGELCVKGSCVQPTCNKPNGCAGNRICRPSTNSCFESCSNIQCSNGKKCVDGACVNDACAGKKCPLGQVCRAGSCELIRCNGTNVCRYGRVCNPGTNGCEDDLCKGVTCPGLKAICKYGQCIQPPQCRLDGDCVAPAVCVKGKCVVGRCNANADCASNELCVENECVRNPCSSVRCKDGSFCRGGKCIPTCAGVFCPAGELCVDGKCTKNPCANVQCAQTETCINGKCERSLCNERKDPQDRCRHGRICNKDACFTDPCLGVTCASGQTCDNGQCIGALPCKNDKDCPGKGVCVEKKCAPPDCYETACAKGSLCIDGNCVDDKCKQANCADDEVCRPLDGKCIKVCSLCKQGQRCVNGVCEIDPCAEVKCAASESCVEGKCVQDLCRGKDKLCKFDRQCTTGTCSDALCVGMQCKQGQTCVKGQCVQTQSVDKEEPADENNQETTSDAGENGPGDGGSKESAGKGDGQSGELPQPPGGGCDCQSVPSPFLPGFSLLLLVAVWRRRRR